MYRRREGTLEVLLVHPGGPFWAKKDAGVWSIPKGEYGEDEDALAAARREFEEETGFRAEGEFVSLGEVKQAGGKVVSAWAFEGDLDVSRLMSGTFAMEWPPRSGKMADFPEVDRAGWFSRGEAREKILKGQLPLLDALERVM
jgi:predicted NUDIX family NTP pyrophosphohydrolase